MSLLPPGVHAQRHSLVARALSALNRILRRVFKHLEWAHLAIGIAIGLLLNNFLTIIGGEAVAQFIDDMVPEGVGIIFTVLILNRLGEIRQRRLIREQLVRRAHSRNNRTALDAIEELRVLDELAAGILRGRNMRGANWLNANLYRTDLRDCDLTNARLRGADLVLANLQGATVTPEQLSTTYALYGAIMPDGSIYDGRYNLAGDMEHAERNGIDVDSPEEMAEWFGVSWEHYSRVQSAWEWQQSLTLLEQDDAEM